MLTLVAVWLLTIHGKGEYVAQVQPVMFPEKADCVEFVKQQAIPYTETWTCASAKVLVTLPPSIPPVKVEQRK